MSLSSSTVGGKIKYKIVFLGDQAVGKSAMIEKYIYDKFDETGNPTIGIDFLVKNVVYKNTTYRLQIWDTAGQQRFRSLIPTYLKDANCAIIVYDITNKNSLINAQKWYNLYNQNKTDNQFSILVGNKIDLNHRVITKVEGQLKAKELNIGYSQVSAKTGKKLEQLFEYIIDMLSTGTQNGMHKNNGTQQLKPQIVIANNSKILSNPKPSNKKQKCC